MDLDLDMEPMVLGAKSSEKNNDAFGMDLLMNTSSVSNKKQKNYGGFSLADIDKLDFEISKNQGEFSTTADAAGATAATAPANSSSSWLPSIFSSSTTSSSAPVSGSNDLGASTKNIAQPSAANDNSSSWSNMFKASNVKKTTAPSSETTERDKRRQKKAMWNKLREMVQSNTIPSIDSRLSEDSSFEEVEDEYNNMMDAKRQKDSVRLQRWWFSTLANTVEFANAQFDPFGLQLDGFGDQIGDDIESYDELFAKIYSKYQTGEVSVELQLLIRFALTLSMTHITNKTLSAANTLFNDVIRSDPALMQAFSTATEKMVQDGFNANRSNTMGGVDVNNKANTPIIPAYQNQIIQQESTGFREGPPAPVSRNTMKGPSRSVVDRLQQADGGKIEQPSISSNDDTMDISNGAILSSLKKKNRPNKQVVSLNLDI
jgi:hypothetical protein